MSSYRQQTPEELQIELGKLDAAMQTGSWDRKAACALQTQVILNELARRDQDQQTEEMRSLNEKMVVYTKWMTGLTIAITLMTLVMLSLTLYMAFWKP
ncbi:MAG: hypothetical protein ABSH46_04050 [Bryobacteraceae bacterium]|jgi:hypothetical protein